MYKIIGADGRQYGPVGADQMRRWLAEGRINAQTLVQPDGAQEWKRLGSFSEFTTDPEAEPQPGPHAPPTIGALSSTVAARASNKIPAGVCGILLGGLGIHKFILGHNTAGAIMLLVTIIGGVLTCGVAAGVMHLI
ncbi:MAG: GYF domain-containing protein, partial [Verrucomicrobiota bacterium]